MAPKIETVTGSKHGKNWTEADSLKLIDAYQKVQFAKSGFDSPHLSTFSLLIPLDGNNSGLIFDKIAAKFLQSISDAEGYSTEAIQERWKKLLESYR